jgi:hypothetical protein
MVAPLPGRPTGHCLFGESYRAKWAPVGFNVGAPLQEAAPRACDNNSSLARGSIRGKVQAPDEQPTRTAITCQRQGFLARRTHSTILK